MAFALEVVGRSPKEIQKRVPLALEQVGLSGKENAFPGELSGGEQQRVGIARALVREPLVLLADEPTGNLDPDISRQLMELFDQINRNGTTVIIATHAWDLVDQRKTRHRPGGGRIIRDEQRGIGNEH